MKVIHRRPRRLTFAIATAILISTAMVTAGAAASSSPATKILKGGAVVISAAPSGSLDPASPLLSNTIAPLYNIYDGLFIPNGAQTLDGLAIGYEFGSGDRTLTLHLRHHVKFQDGTPFNAAAVEFSLQRDQSLTSTVSQDLTLVTSITTKGDYTVVIHLSQPDTNLITVLTSTPATFVVSPTAVQRLGSNFGLTPIGAGPFEVTSFTPSVSATFSAWPGYWNQKNRHLSSIQYLNTGTDPLTSYEDLASGSVQLLTDIGLSTPPNVFQMALANPNLSVTKGVDNVWTVLVVNTTKPPFNNLLAREALDYCLDRAAIATSVQDNFANPAYILSGKSEAYFPGVAAAKALMPYAYNVAMGQSIVKSLGGLSFTLNSGNAAQSITLVEAIQSEWNSCGMNVTLNLYSGSVGFADLADGAYQVEATTNGGITNPYLVMAPFSVPTGSEDKFGFNSPTVTNLVNSTGYTSNEIALDHIWSRIYGAEDRLGVNIPFLSASNFAMHSKCLKGVDLFQTSGYFATAYLSCAI